MEMDPKGVKSFWIIKYVNIFIELSVLKGFLNLEEETYNTTDH